LLIPLSSIKKVLKGSSGPCDVLKGYLDPCDEHGFVLGGGFSQEQGAKTVSGAGLNIGHSSCLQLHPIAFSLHMLGYEVVGWLEK